MQAVRYHGDGIVRVDDVAIPSPGRGEVLVRINAAGVCGTDLMVVSGGYGDTTIPVTLGHECVGTVVATGAGVDAPGEGDRVVPEGGWSCGDCRACRSGDGSPCLDRRSLGRTSDGVFAEFAVLPASVCHRIAAEVADNDAQAVVTVATVLRAITRSGAGPAAPVAVVGTGHAGFLFLQVLAHVGAGGRPILALGTRPERLAIAEACGATALVNVRAPSFAEAETEWVQSGGVADVVFEASGTVAGLNSAMRAVRTGGTVVPYSIFSDGTRLDRLADFYRREVTLRGTRGGGGFYQDAISLVEDGVIRPSLLVSNEIRLTETPKAIDAIRHRTEDVLRAVLTPDTPEREPAA